MIKLFTILFMNDVSKQPKKNNLFMFWHQPESLCIKAEGLTDHRQAVKGEALNPC